MFILVDRNFTGRLPTSVIPAKAGIPLHLRRQSWTPAFAGVTVMGVLTQTCETH
jgi:hypothetical protein